MTSSQTRHRKVTALMIAIFCGACTGGLPGAKDQDEKSRADAKGWDAEVVADDPNRPMQPDPEAEGSLDGGQDTQGSMDAALDAGTKVETAVDAGEEPKGPTVDRSDPQLRTFTFEPKALDLAADEWLFTEYAYLDTREPPAGRLVVYLVGAGGKPSGGTAMMQFIAAQGFHVLAPAYANDYGIGNDCDNSDADCKANKRLEAFEGTDRSPHIEVTPANSIETRVIALLRELAKQNPGGDWSFFLTGDQPRWSSIIVMGHSHGASTAAIIGKVRTLDRAISLSGPFDNNNNVPDPWLSWPSKTPVERFYAFSHTLEEQHSGHIAAWAAMGLNAFGAPNDVGVLAAPYNQSHQLITSAKVGNAHGSTAAGGSSPKLPNGNYIFAPVWRHMLAP